MALLMERVWAAGPLDDTNEVDWLRSKTKISSDRVISDTYPSEATRHVSDFNSASAAIYKMYGALFILRVSVLLETSPMNGRWTGSIEFDPEFRTGALGIDFELIVTAKLKFSHI
ncbi:Hypothetical protein NTJ_13978 [Nesidiocoris tenuis]|uniref:Uncharacterized protein n=1 Tax=Nesidiocoris tenuis TaxID=355587 RepID=A0ABN7BDE8_9HEMI|nr:Hypothetical protein NTJ_13978 [Nesidiocoris tenuis]